jgi:hypothetical protein
MLRFNVFVSTIPLIFAGALSFTHGELVPAPRPCIMLGDTSVQIAPDPWQAQLHVSFTDNPADATVRVQIVEGAESADFAVIDDVGNSDPGACALAKAQRFVGIAESPSHSEPVIYLSHDGNADYRIFVQSKTFPARNAAALVVGADERRSRIAAASL